MAHGDVTHEREQFVKELQQTASAKAIPIQKLSWRGVPNKEASELTIESGGKKRVFTVSDDDLINDGQAQIDLIINGIIDNE